MSLANGNVIIQKTHFGWILRGKTPGVAGPIAAKCNLSFNLLNKKICEFWEIENGPNERTKSHEESACEIHFQENTHRDSATGRYIVKLPFKEDSNGLSESYSHALKRFHSLERSLGRNPELKDKYITFMSEYSELDHMPEDKSASIYDCYFLPHHAIIKQSSLTTKLRNVFDASAKTSNGNSLNDILMNLWQLNIGWDESVPPEIEESWLDLKQNLALLREIEINRKIVVNNYVSLQMHGYCDASEKAFGACIYFRSYDKRGMHFTQLVCSKSRVAPLKTLSLPRLELCAAVPLSKLYSTVSQALRRLHIEKTIFWCDSTITLHWINSPTNTLKPFVGNRVAEIQSLTQSLEWRHVRTEHNPADLVSRGLASQQLINNSFWFNGPAWINDADENWPVSHLEPIEIPELKKTVVSLAVNLARVNDITNSLLEKAQSFNKLIRVIAFSLRFINMKVHKQIIRGQLSSAELQSSTICVIKLVQRASFLGEIKMHESKKRIEGRLVLLSPILDSEGVLRVGGRLRNSDLNYGQKHPILLLQNHNVTALIRDQHLKLLHGGSQATLNATRNNYWIINGKTTVKKEKKFRNRIKVKIYVAIFVCLATKAVHIEVVSDLTTEAFLAGLSRFFSRRGKSADFYSDNGTNLVGAKNEIDSICNFLNSEEHNDTMSRVLANHRINWHCIPPRSPHFGGLLEAAVKSFKRHWIRVIGERVLTYEEFTTLATEVEAILNSRPLTSIPSDPNDLTALTPGHFLIGDSIIGVPEHDLKGFPSG
ncbi:uncharacterized protein LOC117177134 [Belonocnema kinseyi]|uniref:uncharacterized protein LOC117177134 n=1 Tax=Belonocnema kinseyi TaxID=2817044 RepID=UPI00143D3660|nr:uncharacterized protein LOC117177134 [Belonocnema kinseyi]